MAAWKRICCPVDFSAVSAEAVEEAAELAWRFGGMVTLLHVREPPSAPPTETVSSPEAAEKAVTVDQERQLESWRERAERVATTSVDSALVTGDAATEIIRFAGEGRHDVIVMGTHGRTGREKVAFGSVAQKVILDAPCPVLVIHARGARPRGADVKGSRFTE